MVEQERQSMTTPKSFKLGEIVRADLGSGLQSQTLNLCRMLKPDRLMLVNSTSFNESPVYPEMYEGFDVQMTAGWPTNLDCARFVKDLTHIITAETAYNPRIYELSRFHDTKVFTQLNWEFLDHIHNPRLPGPYKWLMPSYWKLEEMQQLFPNTVYLPPPIFMNDFKKARLTNFARESSHRRFVHIMGKVASHDRNGTLDLINALKFSKERYQLVIRSQYPVPEYAQLVNDNRVIFDIGNVKEQNDMYEDFDAMVLPRRYGGLCLPMNEALASGLPVIMSDTSPNDKVLPKEWLAKGEVGGSFKARTEIDIFTCDVVDLARCLDRFASMSQIELDGAKGEAYNIAIEQYSSDTLKPKYIEELEL